jgi:hypothetical protein
VRARASPPRLWKLHEIDVQRVREQLVEGAETRRVRRLGNLGEDAVLLSPTLSIGSRVDRMQESLDRIERRLDALGVPPDPGQATEPT